MNITIENITERLKTLPKNLLESVSDYIDNLSVENSDYKVPEWQKKIIAERLENYYKNPDSAVDFDEVFSKIKKDFE